jgi:hypothetical protein
MLGPETRLECYPVTLSRALAVFAFIAAAAGCTAAVPTADGESLAVTSPEFRDYVERVFREQNRIATELAFAIEGVADVDSDAYAALGAADDALLSACSTLNELAALRRDERRLGPLRQLKVAREAPRCEIAMLEARAVLEREAPR